VIKRFDIIWVNLDPTIGREIKKTRPCVVVSPDELNDNLDTVIVAPLTSTIKKWPFRITINITGKESSVALDQIRTISKERMGDKIGTLPPKDRPGVLSVLQAIFAE
jgi:mRNA interferase MazF